VWPAGENGDLEVQDMVSSALLGNVILLYPFPSYLFLHSQSPGPQKTLLPNRQREIFLMSDKGTKHIQSRSPPISAPGLKTKVESTTTLLQCKTQAVVASSV
jgi:hypothetical protein